MKFEIEENPIKEYKTTFERICEFLKSRFKTKNIEHFASKMILKDDWQSINKNMQNFQIDKLNPETKFVINIDGIRKSALNNILDDIFIIEN